MLEFGYRAHGAREAKTRRVAPYGLLSGLRRYLVGRPSDDADGPVRTYRLDALEAVRLTEESFVRPEGFDLQAFSNRSFGVYQSDSEYGEVVWRFCPEAADHARSYQFHPLQTMEDEPDGSLHRTLLGRGPPGDVLAPLQLGRQGRSPGARAPAADGGAVPAKRFSRHAVNDGPRDTSGADRICHPLRAHCPK